MPHCRVILALVLFMVLLPDRSAAQTRGIVGRDAPPWQVDEWFQLSGDAPSIDIDDFRGKVVYLYCFQSWCPGCHSRGFPTLQALISRFEDDDEVAFVAVQTTFEGFETNTAAKALATARRYELTIPIGHSGSPGRRSPLTTTYRTGGTPWTVIIDRAGVVRFNDFHISPNAGELLIKRLLDEPAPRAVPAVTLPASRGGQDRVGNPLPEDVFTRWLAAPASSTPSEPTPDAPAGEEPTTSNPARPAPRLTLYRWWTDACPYCEASLPAIETLRRKYEKDGLRVVGAYHPKPPRPVSDAFIRAAAARLGFSGEIAVDENWTMLKDAYLTSGRRRATSITLLVDDAGVIRFVHPGPQFFPSTDPRDERENDDYKLLERAIRRLLDLDDGEADTPPAHEHP